jgi:uncharacterized protein (TIGR02145 family)
MSMRVMVPLLAAAAVALPVWFSGRSKKPERETVPEIRDTFTDPRDGKKYRTAIIDGERWMAENLNYETPDSSWCYENSPDSCAKYGRLYHKEVAIKACPPGWYLPSIDDWLDLDMTEDGSEVTATMLKAKSGWGRDTVNNVSNNGTDDYGFSALPGGFRRDRGSFENVGFGGHWWMVYPHIYEKKYYLDGYRIINPKRYSSNPDRYFLEKDYGEYSYGFSFSVRCLQDSSGNLPDSIWMIRKAEKRRKKEERRLEKLFTYFTDARDGQKYRSVVIGGKTWMAQNLNYETPDSSWCYENSPDSCAKYGRLYAWNAAMTACPDGWRPLSRHDIKELEDSAGLWDLCSKSGWKSSWFWRNTNKHGFSVLPGGARYSDGFGDAGEDGVGYLWLTTKRGNGRTVYNLNITNEGTYADDYSVKSNGYSVRCIRRESDDAEEKSDAEQKRLVKKNTSYFTDSRDGRRYRAIKIGDDTWMAENLNYQPPTGNSWCYKNDDSYCDKYGRMYDWKTALRACPAGWHLSSRDDWTNLVVATGNYWRTSEHYNGGTVTWLEAGLYLKSKTGWSRDTFFPYNYINDAADNYGFSALPGGYRARNGKFDEVGKEGSWWEVEMTGYIDDNYFDYQREMYYNSDRLSEDEKHTNHGNSVRCVRNRK